jgi:hypothetical protein
VACCGPTRQSCVARAHRSFERMPRGIRAQDRDEKGQSKRFLSSLAHRDERSRVTRFLVSCVCVLVVDRGPEAESLAHLSCSRTPEAGVSAQTGGLGYGVEVREEGLGSGLAAGGIERCCSGEGGCGSAGLWLSC